MNLKNLRKDVKYMRVINKSFDVGSIIDPNKCLCTSLRRMIHDLMCNSMKFTNESEAHVSDSMTTIRSSSTVGASHINGKQKTDENY